MNINSYFKNLEQEVKSYYELAGKARAAGFDPATNVEIPLATSLAERVLGLVSVLYPQINDRRIVERIHELEKQYGSLDPAVSLVIAEEVAKEKFCKFETHLQAIEAGIRVALGYLTLGYVSSPIEGFIQLKLKKTKEGKDYFAPYYSGPIRSAGGTEAAFSLVVADYLRELFGYARYDPTDEEAKRGIHECYEYHERITNLQYLPSEQELDFLLKNIPLQISGDPSEDKEVFNYKDLPRIETNFIRSGFTLVTGEGLAQKAPKILKRVEKLREKGFKLSGWDWLAEFVKLQKKIKESKKGDSSRAGATYIQDLVAGRPVYAHPSRSGGFRLRYGRGRTTGYSALALHPATMGITQGFIAVGTQLKIEKPTKGCTVASCDEIDGPIVLLKDGSVKKIKTSAEALKIYNDVQQIIYLGDLLVPYGDFFNRNHVLEKPGYVEEWWELEYERASGRKFGSKEISFSDALKISQELSIPLYPKFIFYWKEIDSDFLFSLIDWMARGIVVEEKLVLPFGVQTKERFVKGKRALELIGCEHEVTIEHVVVRGDEMKALLLNLGIDWRGNLEEQIDMNLKRIVVENVLETVNVLSRLKIKDKSGTFIGARMGRPEKAKLRKLTGSPHVLFPVGDQGGRLRSVLAAFDVGYIKSEFANFRCDNCNKDSVYARCDGCGKTCKRYVMEDSRFGQKNHSLRNIDAREYFENARKIAGMKREEISLLKGVRGTSNKDHSCEHLSKGFLRSKYNLHVNKDGTVRYDMTEMPVTHFKPIEVGTSIEKLRELGYERDIYGKNLENENQILEIFPHDIILPACPETPDEKASDVFLNVVKFVDDEFDKLYGLGKIYNSEKKEDLVGKLFGCMSPHTSASVVGRLIGFSKVQALLASPYIHAAMRRDCDGDEAAVLFLMDLLLNFSRSFIPSHRGGTQDAPLVLNARIRANEVDDMIFDVDVFERVPLELYEAAEQKKQPFDVKLEQVKSRLGGEREFSDLHFSFSTGNFNDGPLCSSYKTLPTMQDKVDHMMDLCKKIRAVDVADVARLIIERHFIRDTRGNLRKFSMQGFRCVGCNEKFRRPPLIGKCTKCGGKIIFTISEGSILKYMQPALELARNYGAEPYLLESLELTEMYIQSIFGKEKEKQEALGKWF